MPRSDDSSLDPAGLHAVETRAHALLDRASAWGRFPTPVDDILTAANLKVAASNAFDMKHVMAFIAGKASDAARVLRSALSKVLGVLDAQDGVIHIDTSVTTSKQNFLKLHEAGHHELPVHRRLFAFFQDCEKNLDPAVAELFEREANNFARFVLFQGGGFATQAADMAMSIKTPMGLASRFGASIYASCREFVRTNRRECAVYVLEPAELVQGIGFRAKVRRVEASPAFVEHFGRPQAVEITPDHVLGTIVPIGRRLTRPTSLFIRDRNGDRVEAVGEAFDTTHNVILLLYTVRAFMIAA
jgi:hypothetical protein